MQLCVVKHDAGKFKKSLRNSNHFCAQLYIPNIQLTGDKLKKQPVGNVVNELEKQ